MGPNKENIVGWFEIYVEDMARARKFYETVFNIKLESLGVPESEADVREMLTFPGAMGTYGCPGALVYIPGVPIGGSGIMIYFSCEDCAVEESRVVDAGGRVEKPKSPIGEYGFVSIVQDSEGNFIGLHTAPKKMDK